MKLVAPALVNVEASTTQKTITTTVVISVENLSSTSKVFLGGNHTINGLLAAAIEPTSTGGILHLAFRNPGWNTDQAQPGLHTDALNLFACLDASCTSHIEGSPLAITVAYKVIEAPTAVTLDQSGLALSGNNIASHAPVEDDSISVALVEPTPDLFVRTSTTGGGAVVTQALIVGPSQPATQGKLKLTLRPPSTLGAGTYTDTVKVEVCLNDSCTKQAAGSPANVAVSYEITGSDHAMITVHWSQGLPGGADLVTAETRSPKLTLTLSPSEAIPEGVFVRHTDSATGLIADVVEISYAHGLQFNATLGEYELRLKPPSALGSGAFTDTMEFEACFDRACTEPVPDSKYTVSLNLLVTATEGVEFTRRRATGIATARDIAWSPANQLLYVASSSGTDHRILELNPGSLAVTPGPALGAQDLRNLAVTSDGAFLYAGSSTQPFVYRFALPTLTPDLSVYLGGLMNDIATLPGQPQSFVASVVGAGTSNGGVYVYDTSTARPDSVQRNPSQAFESPRWLVPAGPGIFLSQNYGPSVPKVNAMEQLAVGTGGISVAASSPTGHEFGFPKPALGGSRLFTLDGKVLDATTGAILGALPGFGSMSAYAMVTDEARRRLFVWRDVNLKHMVVSYDIDTLELLAFAPVYGEPAGPGAFGRSMALWGDDGLALVDSNGAVTLLSGPFFTTYRGEPIQ